MTLSRLTAVLDKQLEADKEFASNTKGISDRHAEATVDRSSPPSSGLTAPLKLDKQLEANTPERQLHLGQDSFDPPGEPRSSPAKAWRDASDLVRPQLEELHRRLNLTGTRLSSARRWIKWLPIICFFCTLFGFALGWGLSTLQACGSWHTAQQLDIVAKPVGDRGNKIAP